MAPAITTTAPTGASSALAASRASRSASRMNSSSVGGNGFTRVIPFCSMASAQVDQLKLAMAATNELFCSEVVGKRNFAALDHVYTSGARILPPGAPMISGREAVKTFWAGLVEATNAKSVALSSVEVIPAGDGIVEIGRATLT